MNSRRLIVSRVSKTLFRLVGYHFFAVCRQSLALATLADRSEHRQAAGAAAGG
jgi:hypothetical protein